MLNDGIHKAIISEEWLENNCGFEPGTNIKVLCEEGRLVIERC